MIGLDTNILARYFVEDRADAPAELQRKAARRLIESGQKLKVAKTVLLELEWVLRGYYGFRRDEILPVFRELSDMPHVTIEDSLAVQRAVENYAAGLDFADALHHATYADCRGMASFDDRGFARRAKKIGLAPGVSVPK